MSKQKHTEVERLQRRITKLEKDNANLMQALMTYMRQSGDVVDIVDKVRPHIVKEVGRPPGI